ncbi:Lsr2 family protein [Streptomyces vinaceus]|uniref:histone-like nucleoid-structuring protein Lsr2 n=1 Tax=Streptomyces vinaceus TaxID=1960 RepID=UPI003824BD83
MVQKRVTIYIDDLTGKETQDGGTHTFSLDGVEYALDLSPESYDTLLEAFGPFIKVARRTRKTKRRQPSGERKTSAEDGSSAAIRAWAKASGLEVNARGRVPVEVREAYLKAR